MRCGKFIAHRRGNVEQSVCSHLIGVAEKAGKFAEKMGLGCHGELVGLAHDLGKYSQAFQNYIKSAEGLIDQDADGFVDAKAMRGKIDHSSAGAQWIWESFSSREDSISKMLGQALALCVASHHSGLIDCLDADGEDNFTRRMEKPDEKTHLEEARRCVDRAVADRFEALIRDDRVVMSFHDILQRLAKESPSKKVRANQMGLLIRMLFSCLVDADRIDTIDFQVPESKVARQSGEYVPWEALIDRLEKTIASFESDTAINRMRAEISEACRQAAQRPKGTFTLSVPTGGGKTLASLRFALHHAHIHAMDRIIYVVPFTSIIDQNAEVARNVLEREGDEGRVVLEHHSNLSPEKESWRDKLLAGNWDAPVVYTTMVQFLDALFAGGTSSVRRMHQMANSVLIFDEIQSLPVNCVHLFNNAINFLVRHCGATAVMCTATQPILHKVDVCKGALLLQKKAEIVPDAKALFCKMRRVEVFNRCKPEKWSVEELVALADGCLQEMGNCLIIVNTKSMARKLFLACKDSIGVPVFHLSTGMCPAHRRIVFHKMKKHLKNRQPLICVSTQLIEAGVDIDFGAVIRSLAGLDSVAQAAGRCNRNGAQRRGKVILVNPADEYLGCLKDIQEGRDCTERLLQDFAEHPEQFDHDLLGIEAMEWFYENHFFRRADEMAYPTDDGDTLLNMLADNEGAVSEYQRKRRAAPAIPFRQSFMAAAKAFKAIDAPTRGVIVPYGEGEEIIVALGGTFDVRKNRDLLRKAQPYTVSLFDSDFQSLKTRGAIFPIQEGVDIFHLDPRFYDDEDFGVSLEPVGKWGVCCG